MEIKFYRCPICGQIAIKVLDKSIPLVCCGKPMEELKPNTTDAANEKHVPVIVREGNKVVVKAILEKDLPTDEKFFTERFDVQLHCEQQRNACHHLQPDGYTSVQSCR